MKEGFDADNVVRFADFKKKREEAKAEKAGGHDSFVIDAEAVRRKKLLDSVSEKEIYNYANRVLEKYAEPGALLKDSLRHQAAAVVPSGTRDITDDLTSQRAFTKAYSDDDLKVLLIEAQQAPEYYHPPYLLAVAEEFLERFRASNT